MTTIYKRDMAHIIESTKYGKLYQIQGVHGNKAICVRCHVIDGTIMINKNERITIVKQPDSILDIARGDFAFVDNGNRNKRCWSLFKIKKAEENV